MTAVLNGVAADEVQTTHRSSDQQSGQQQDRQAGVRSFGADAVATVAVACYSVATAAGFARVFSGWSFLADMVVIAVGGHLGCMVLRRLRWPAWAAVPVSAAWLVWLVTFVYYRTTMRFALPTGATWDLFRLELESVREQFPTAIAPVVYGEGWDVLAAIGLAFVVLLADVFAFRAFARAETLVPGGVLFVFVGALGSERSRVALTALLVAAGAATTVVLRAYHGRTGHRGGTIAALRRVGPAAVAATVVVALGAALIGPRLPGADAEPLYDTHGGDGDLANVLSPLVDIRSRLTNRSDEELFRVRAEMASYWRSTALAEFDGTTWTLPAQTLRDDQPDPSPSSAMIARNRQQITIAGLGGSLVPAAPVPINADPTHRLRWLADSATLVAIGGDLAPGDAIDVTSQMLLLDQNDLLRATADSRLDPVYTALPRDLPSVVTTEAQRIAGGARTPYAAALALQDWFQRDFAYSLEVQPGHDNSAIEAFLDARVGYCEQFAGTFAAMMRVLGYPSRVAVGFTSGVPAADGAFLVRGRNAHAWPEVWFDDIGWVAFEPTPGRGAPGAEAYTGLPARQDDTPLPDGVGNEPVPVAPTTTVPRGSSPGQGNFELPDRFDDLGTTPTEATPDTPQGRDLRTPIVLVVIAAAIALPEVVRRLRRRARRSPESQLARFWGDAVAAVRRGGVDVRASDTPLEAADTAARTLPLVARPFGELAEVVTAATYGPATEGSLTEGSLTPGSSAPGSTPGLWTSATVDRCRGWTRQIERAVDGDMTPWQRVVRYFTVWR